MFKRDRASASPGGPDDTQDSLSDSDLHKLLTSTGAPELEPIEPIEPVHPSLFIPLSLTQRSEVIEESTEAEQIEVLRPTRNPTSFEGTQISWDVSTQSKLAGGTQSKRSSDSFSQDLAIDDLFCEPAPTTDPETDLIAKFAIDPNTIVNVSLSNPTELAEPIVSLYKKQKRTESDAEVLLKTPVRPRFSPAINLRSPGAIRKSLQAASNAIPALGQRKLGVQSFQHSKVQKRELIRHATSPAIFDTTTKVKRLLNLADRIVPPSSCSETATEKSEGMSEEKSETDPDTLEDIFQDSFPVEIPSIAAMPPSPTQKESLVSHTTGVVQPVNTDHLFPQTDSKPPPSTFGSDLEDDVLESFVLDELQSTKLYRQPVTQINSVIMDDFNIEDFFDSDSSFDDDDLVTQFDTFYEDSRSLKLDSVNPDSFRSSIFNSQSTTGSATESSLISSIRNRKVHRLRVTNVAETLSSQDDCTLEEVCLTAVMKDQEYTIILRDNWLQSVPQPGDVVNLIGDLEPTVVIDNEQNMLVLHPDSLMTCTNVSDSFYCMRKTILQSRLRGPGDTNIHMVYGSMIHELFQFCLITNNFALDLMKRKIGMLVISFLEQLYLCDVTPEDATKYLLTKVPKIREWGAMFVANTPNPHALVDDHRTRSRILMSFRKIIETEDELWSPALGVKGISDATVEAHLKDSGQEGNFLCPLEIKSSTTNIRSIGHHAQTTLYALLLADRYNIEINSGILVYTETGKTIRLPWIENEIRDLMIQRNRLAVAMKNKAELPPMTTDEHLCETCDHAASCTVFKYAETMEQPTIEPYMEYLLPNRLAFFKENVDALAKEEALMTNHLTELWTMTSSEREQVGRCFGKLQILKVSQDPHYRYSNRYIHTFRRNPVFGDFDMNNDFIKGDYIIVSDEHGHTCLATGSFIKVSPKIITVSLNRPLTEILQKMPGFNEHNNQAYKSLINPNSKRSSAPSTKFRIDRNEFAQTMNIARNNLVTLMFNKHAELVVDLRAPKFCSVEPFHNPQLNNDQLASIQKCIAAEDYALMLGTAGTGKTLTLAVLIEHLVAQGKTILVAANSNSSVDNLLLKLKNCERSILRLGYKYCIHPDVHKFTPGWMKSREQLQSVYMMRPIVAVTCSGLSHWLFCRRRFDYCIIDDAADISLASSIGPIQFADKFILAGDSIHFDESLLERLSKSHPAAVTTLGHQYRMCEDIAKFLDRLLSDDKLNHDLANPTASAAAQSSPDGWLEQSMQIKYVYFFEISGMKFSNCYSSEVLFLETDSLEGRQGMVQAKVAVCFKKNLVQSGLLEKDIGLFCTNRAQLKELRMLLPKGGEGAMLTIDRWQGSEMTCAIICLADINTTELEQYWRKLITGFSRAKQKLLIIGSRTQLQSCQLQERFLAIVDQEKWTLPLPKNIFTSHIFDINSIESTPDQGRRLATVHVKGPSKKALSRIGPITRDVIAGHKQG